MSRRVLFLSKGEHSASTRYRALQYFSELNAAGWSPQHLTVSGSIRNKITVLSAAKKADVVVLVRHALNGPFLSALRRRSKVLVFDYDDAVFLKSSGAPSKSRKKRYESTLARCDAVWAGNEYLAEHARQWLDNVSVIPTSVDVERYTQRSSGCENPDTVDLVWIGSSSTRRYLESLLPTLEKAARKNPSLRLKIIADFALQSEVLKVVPITWSHDTEVDELQQSDIGIAPMKDDPWTRGKCALKVLQYLASGLPVVSSAAGANKEILQQADCGVLVEDEAGWLDAIESLASDCHRRKRLGTAGLALCTEQYSLRACALNMIENLESFLPGQDGLTN